MNKPHLLLLFIFLLTLSSRLWAADPKAIAFIEEVKGDVSLQSAGHIRKLDPSRDKAMILREGEVLQCAKAAQVLGQPVSSPSKTLEDLCIHDGAKGGLGRNPEVERALNAYGARAGRDKGDDVPIFSPPNNGAVIAETFVMRWRTRPPIETFTVLLEDSQGHELSRIENVSGAEGKLDSQVFRDALLKLADTNGSHTAKLTLRSQGVSDVSVVFAVLTSAQKGELKAALAQQAQTPGLLRLIERAAVFESFQLFSEAASEYSSALSDAPESRDLLQAAFNAYSRTGDFATARVLRDRLDKVDDGE